jgi:hypothetical protein
MQPIHDTNEKEAKQEEKNLDLITTPQAKEKIYRFFIDEFSLIHSPNVVSFLKCRVIFGMVAKIALLYFKMEDADLKRRKRSGCKLVFGFLLDFPRSQRPSKAIRQIFEGDLVWFILAHRIV